MSRRQSYDAPLSAAGVRMQAFSAILAIALLAACAEGGAPPLVSDQIRVGFPAGGIADVIEVSSVSRLPLRKAELIAPDGQSAGASYLNVNATPSLTSYAGLPSALYTGNAFGVGNNAAGMPLPALTGGAPEQRAAFLAMVSGASIPLPDPVEYRRDWRNYRIRLSFGDPPGEVETREVPAPEPPSGG